MNLSSKIEKMSESNKPSSLKYLLIEEDENISFDIPEDDPDGDEGSGDEESEVTQTDDSDENQSSEGEQSEVDDSEQTEELSLDPEQEIKLDPEQEIKNLSNQAKELSDQLRFITKTILPKDSELSSVEDYLQSNLFIENSQLYSQNSIKNYLINEEDSSKAFENLEDDIESLDKVLSKGKDLIQKFDDLSKDIDINSYVKSAVNAYKNFDSLFSKEDIVAQASRNILALNSGKESEEFIKQFEELFYKELKKKFGIENPRYEISNSDFDTASGAVKQA